MKEGTFLKFTYLTQYILFWSSNLYVLARGNVQLNG